MGIVLDLMVIVIIALSTFLGYKKGLVKVAVKLCAFVIAVVITFMFYKPVSNIIINNTQLDEKIEGVIIEKGTKEIVEDSDGEDFMTHIQKYVGNTVAQTQNDMTISIAKIVSEKLINIIAIIGLFVATRLALVLLTVLSDIITNIPIIKQFNKAGGLIYGLVRALVIVYILLAVIFFVSSISANNEIIELVNQTIIIKFMYANNILLNIIF